MYSAWRIAVTFTAQNFTGSAFNQILSGATRAHGAIGSVQSELIGLAQQGAARLNAFANASIAAFAKAADSAGEYQLKMMYLQQQLNASDSTMQKLGRTIFNLTAGKTPTGFSAEQVAGAALELQQSGLTAEQVNRVLPQIIFAAEIESGRHFGVKDPQQFAAYLGSTIKGYGLAEPGREKEMARFADLYTRVASTAHLNAQGLRIYEQNVGSVARTMGLSPEDFVMSAGFFTQQGMSPSRAGTMMKNILTNLTPQGGITQHSMNRQFASMMLMGMLNPPSPGAAKKYQDFYEERARALGLPAMNPANMTAKQQEAYAETLMRAVVTSKASGAGLHGLFDLFGGTLQYYKNRFGDKHGTSMFEQDMRNVFNLRGMVGSLSMAFAGEKGFKEFNNLVQQQMQLDKRRTQWAGTLPGEQQIFASQQKTWSRILGGADNAGKATPGGPLDIMRHLMGGLVDLNSKVLTFVAQRPKLAAALGDLTGIAGVVGKLGSFAISGIATLSIIALNRSIAGLAITSGVASGTLKGGFMTKLFGWLGGVRIPAAAGAAGAAAAGEGGGTIFAAIAGGLGSLAAAAAPFIALAVAAAAQAALFYAQFKLMWMMITDPKQFGILEGRMLGTLMNMRDAIGKALGGIPKWVTGTLWPAIVAAWNNGVHMLTSAVTNLIKYIAQLLSNPATIGNALSGIPGAIGKWIHDHDAQFQAGVQQGIQQTHPSASTKPKGSTSTSKSGSTGSVSYHQTNHVEVHTGSGNPKEIGKKVADALNSRMAWLIRTQGTAGSPRIYAAAGGA